MPLTPDMERALAKVEIASLLKKADTLRERWFKGAAIHVKGFDVAEQGVIRTVRPLSLCDGVTLEEGR
jgi:hypothetical protein